MTEKEFSQYKGLNFKYIKLYFLDIINKLHTQTTTFLMDVCFFYFVQHWHSSTLIWDQLQLNAVNRWLFSATSSAQSKNFSPGHAKDPPNHKATADVSSLLQMQSADRSSILESVDDDIRQPSIKNPRKFILRHSFTAQNAQVMP